MSIYQQQVEIDLPFRVDNEGRIATTTDPRRQLRNRIVGIIGTELGSRVMRPEYGTPLQSALFEADDEMTASIIANDIRKAIIENEPGAEIQEVFFDQSGGSDGIVSLNVTYVAVNTVDTLVVPVNTALLRRGGTVEEERSG